jgi:tetratricopeptide (TPR) repeat protein
MPDNFELLEARAFVRRRQGLWRESQADLDRAVDLSPLDAHAITELAYTNATLRDYPLADAQYRRSIQILPDQSEAYIQRATLIWVSRGSTGDAGSILAAIPGIEASRITWHKFWNLVYEERFAEAIRTVREGPEEILSDQHFLAPKALLEAQALELSGELKQARTAYQAALERLDTELELNPHDFRIHGSRGLALAGLGRSDEAVSEGRKAVELYPIAKDAYAGPSWTLNLALIYTKVGELDAAFRELEHLLSIPSWVSIPLIGLDPRWKPLRDHDRFEELAQRFSVTQRIAGDPDA